MVYNLGCGMTFYVKTARWNTISRNIDFGPFSVPILFMGMDFARAL